MQVKRFKFSTFLYYIIIICVILALDFCGKHFHQSTAQGEVQVHFIDVGQGDSVLIRTDDKNMLIDAGTNYATDAVLSYLEQQDVDSLDIVVATHSHEDHIGGLSGVIEMFGAEIIYITEAYADTIAYTEFMDTIEDMNVVITESGDEFFLGKARFSVLAPNSPKYSVYNNHSICLRMTYGENSFLFMGDAEKKSEKEIIKKGYNIDSDVLKVGHHGSEDSSIDKFIDLVTPSISVISVGAFNDYDLPDRVVTQKLENYGDVYRTDFNGNIVITSDGSNLKVRSDYK